MLLPLRWWESVYRLLSGGPEAQAQAQQALELAQRQRQRQRPRQLQRSLLVVPVAVQLPGDCQHR